MKLMQINTWQGRLIKPLLALIHDESPDIIFAQEIYSFPVPIDPNSPWNSFRTLELIAAQNGYEHVYFSPTLTVPMFGQTLSFGNAILSRSRFSHTSTHYTNEPGPAHLDGLTAFDGNRTRNFQHVVVNTGKTDLNLINHHAHWITNPLGDEVSTQRLLHVAEYIKSLSGPVVVAGDFNVSADSPAMAAFHNAVDLHDLVAATDSTTTLSGAHYIQNVVCDYILTTPSLKINAVKVIERLVSDHKAIIAQINC